MNAAILTQSAEQRRKTLEQLMRMIAQQPNITLALEDNAETWSIDLSTWIVNAPTSDLSDRDDNFCQGVAVHEAAHAAITRLGDMVPERLHRQRPIHALLNTLEDLRIEDWVAKRFPGTEDWIAHCNSILWGPTTSWQNENLPLCLQYNFGAILKWLGHALPNNTHPDVVAALEDTWPWVGRIVQSQPPAIFQTPSAMASAYRESHLQAIYWRLDQDQPPDAFEMAVRLQQWRMWELVYMHILPVYERLVAHDIEQNATRLHQVLGQWLRQMRAHRVLQRSKGRAVLKPPHQSLEPDDSPHQDSDRGEDSKQDLQTAGKAGNDHSEYLEDNVKRALEVDANDAYLAAWKRIARAIDLLADELMQVFQRDQRLRWRRGFSQGERLNLRQAMHFDAKPECYTELWMRKTLPTVLDPAVVLLLDRSGSMDGEGIQYAFDGAVLLVEVCTRLQIPVEIWSFANDLTQDMTWDQTPNASVREALASILRRTGGGTKMHTALSSLRVRFQQCPRREPILFVLSDGMPSEIPNTKRQINDLRNDGVSVVGLGLGPETNKMVNLFPESVVGINPSELVGKIVHRLIVQLTSH